MLLICRNMLFAFAFGHILLIGCGKTNNEKSPVQNKRLDTIFNPIIEEVYICRLHPFERANMPGKCPVCGAEMVSLRSYNDEMLRKNEDMKKKWKSYVGAAYTVIDLPGVKCSDCEKILVNTLMKNKGILDFQVDIANKDVFLFYDPLRVKLSEIESLITGAGFDTNDKKADAESAASLPPCCR